jgi:hypothetical protein
VIDGALAAARAAHFAAVLLLQGGIMVRFLVAAAALKAIRHFPGAAAGSRRRHGWLRLFRVPLG